MAKLTFYDISDPVDQQPYIDRTCIHYETADREPRRFLIFFKLKPFIPTIIEF